MLHGVTVRLRFAYSSVLHGPCPIAARACPLAAGGHFSSACADRRPGQGCIAGPRRPGTDQASRLGDAVRAMQIAMTRRVESAPLLRRAARWVFLFGFVVPTECALRGDCPDARSVAGFGQIQSARLVAGAICASVGKLIVAASRHSTSRHLPIANSTENANRIGRD